MEGFDDVRHQRAPYLWQNLEEAVPADSIEGLCQVYGGYKKRQSLPYISMIGLETIVQLLTVK